jgi:hypothetical protein
MGVSSLASPSIGNLAVLFVNVVLLLIMLTFTAKVSRYMA